MHKKIQEMIQNLGGYAHINTKGKPGLYSKLFYQVFKQPIAIVLKHENQGLPMGFCNILNIPG